MTAPTSPITSPPAKHKSPTTYSQSPNPPVSTTSSTSQSELYSDPIGHGSSGTTTNRDVDYKLITKHFVADPLNAPGGDIVRHMQHQLDSAEDHIGTSKLRRSSSFSTFLTETRRESTASDINVPGGFRRQFLINKSLQQNKSPPNFLTQNFIEFLSIYGHFAGEDLDDDDEDDEDKDVDDVDDYEDVFDEESHLLAGERRPNLPKLVPLLPRAPPQRKGTASVAKTYFLVFKSLVGSGVLFLPRAFYNGGLEFSIVALSSFGLLTFFCYLVLIQSKRRLGLDSFGELGFRTYGKPLKYSIMVSIIISQLGFVGTYILFTAENVGSFVREKYRWEVSSATIVIVQCILLIPLVLIRNLTKLSFISLISSLFIVIGLVIIFYFCGLNLAQNGIGPNIEKFNSNSWSMLIGVAVTSFEGIGLVLPIESAMANPEKFPQVLSISMLIITTLFVSIGTMGYTSFGDQVKSIIILNLPQSNVGVQSIMILYSLAVFLTAPLQLFPAIKIGESILFNKGHETGKLYRSGKWDPQVKWLKNFFRTVSVNANNIDRFVSFNGCFACIPMVYIYPPLIHIKSMEGKQLSTKEKVVKYCDYGLITVGIVTVIYTTYQILFLN
jgi:proton-coupled amino acid transporter